jgi:glucose/arabinose dehydrogenase
VPLQSLEMPQGFHVSVCRGPDARKIALGAHGASPGLRLYMGQMFPAAYHDAIFIARHGSWNRSSKAGYRGVVVHVGKDGRKTLDRPADVQPLRDAACRFPLTTPA